MKTTTISFLFYMLLAPILIFGQTKLTGTVTEQTTSSPLPGVNVVIKGTTTGTATDFDGRYQIEPVSYTHLDVYKRQAPPLAMFH